MKAIENLKKYHTYRHIRRITIRFPRPHLVAASALSFGLLLVNLIASENIAETPQHKTDSQILASGKLRTTIDIPGIKQASKSSPEAVSAQKTLLGQPLATDLEKAPKQNSFLSSPGADPTEATTTRQAQIQNAKKFEPVTLKVKSGDTLSKLFKRAGLSDKQMFKLVNSGEAGKELSKIRPGNWFDFYIDNKELTKLVYHKNKLKSSVYSRLENTPSKYELESVERLPELSTAFRSGTIKKSLYLAASKAKLDDKVIMEFASIFGWDVDFALDIRKGDHFKVLFEEEFLDDKKIGNGSILAAEFSNQGITYRAVRYIDEKDQVNYYTPTGESMRKAFLRAPLDFRRISSNFNPRRLHPISKVVKPHRGTDYAAARGTPVWSSGDGRVIRSGYTKANGNYIVIQHGNNIQTKYLHLHKRYVSSGKRVKQKQKIGTVGSTGYSTAPHLHYEFLLNGVHRNPRTIVNKLPKAKSIEPSELGRFLNQTQPLMAELKEEGNTTKFAQVGGQQNKTL